MARWAGRGDAAAAAVSLMYQVANGPMNEGAVKPGGSIGNGSVSLARESRLRKCPHRPAQAGGSLVVSQALEVAQDNRSAVLLGQAVDFLKDGNKSE